MLTLINTNRMFPPIGPIALDYIASSVQKAGIDVKIVDYGYRSVTGVPFPLDVNNVGIETLEAIPGVGKKRAARLLLKKPFFNEEQLVDSLDDAKVGRKLLEYIKFK